MQRTRVAQLRDLRRSEVSRDDDRRSVGLQRGRRLGQPACGAPAELGDVGGAGGEQRIGKRGEQRGMTVGRAA